LIYSYLITIFLLLYILVSIISLLHNLLTTSNINFTKYKIIDKINLLILHLYPKRFVFVYLIRLVFIYIYDKIRICFLWNSGGEHPHLLSLTELLASSKHMRFNSFTTQHNTRAKERTENTTTTTQHKQQLMQEHTSQNTHIATSPTVSPPKRRQFTYHRAMPLQIAKSIKLHSTRRS
jgi:hypothetical protein